MEESKEREGRSSGSEEGERHDTSGVIEEESIVKSIEKIIDSEEAKEMSPERGEGRRDAEDYIKVLNDETPREEEVEAEMQIPCEQGGVWGPVPVWGGMGNEGHLKAFSTDFWVWSKFSQRQATPAQQTKYFSTN